MFNTLLGRERDEAMEILNSINADSRAEYLLTNDERDFIATLNKTTHIHWPQSRIEKLRELQDKLGHS